jgi:WXXGXW repeat (2 copies)
MKKHIAAAVLAAGTFLATSVPAAAQVYITVAPPAPIVETAPASPGAGYVWVPGYYRWNGSRYVWVHGHYVRHAGHWCTGKWHHNAARGWWYAQGHWC